ncbi:8911_t:CDS:2, partial [Entrophospora sp. SA101]
ENFVEANKKIIKDKSDEQARNEVAKLDKKLLEDKILSEEEIEKIIRFCEKDNLLTNPEFLNSLSNLRKLESVDIGLNKFLESDLKPFGNIANLGKSKKLKELDISNTDINEGLENLPAIENENGRQLLVNELIQNKEAELERLLSEMKERISTYELENQDYEYENHNSLLEA